MRNGFRLSPPTLPFHTSCTDTGISTAQTMNEPYQCTRVFACILFLIATLALLVVSPAANASISRDQTISYDQSSPSSTVTTPAFTTKYTQEVLLAFVSTGKVTSPNTTVVSVTGGGLTWVLVQRTNNQYGTSEIWRAFSPGILTYAKVTANLSQSVSSSITVMSYLGVNTSGTNGSGAIGAVGSGYAASGAPNASLITTGSNSVVIGVGNDFDAAIARTPAQGQTLFHQNLSANGNTFWVQKLVSQSAGAGASISISDSAPTSDQYNLTICELLAAPTNDPQLSYSATSLSYGSVQHGSTQTKSLTLYSSGGQAVTLTSATVSGTGFSIGALSLPITLNPGKTLTIPVTFAALSVGSMTGQLTLTSNSTTGATTSISLSGTGITSTPQISLSGSNLAFGNVTDGTTKSLSLTIQSSGTSALTVSSASVAGTGFSLGSTALPITLNPGQTLTVPVTYAPLTAGSVTGSLTILSNSSTGSKSVVSLTGTGVASVPRITLSTTALSLGTVTLGSSSNVSVTLSSTGTAVLTIQSASLTGAGFSIVGGSFPITLNPGASTSVTVQFLPTVQGSATGVLTITSNSAVGATSTVGLTGTGAANYSVNLNWNAPGVSADPVAGYHVYRTVSGTTTSVLLRSSLDTQTTYTDRTVVSGTKYVYDVKSVDYQGVESAASNPFTVTIP